MNKKKILSTGVACVLLVAALAVPASAHGGHGGGHHGSRSTTTTYTVCTVEDCTKTGRHNHDGVTYCGSNSCANSGTCSGHGGYGGHC